MGLSHLNEYKFKHNSRDFLKPLCACTLGPETTFHYLLGRYLFQTEWRTLLNDIKEVDEHLITDHKNDLDQILLYENWRYRYDTNGMVLLSTIRFFIDSRRFDLLLFYFAFYVRQKLYLSLNKNLIFFFSFLIS